MNKFGFVDLDQLDLLLNEDVAMITCMLANNEIGSIQPIAEITKRIRAFESIFSISFCYQSLLKVMVRFFSIVMLVKLEVKCV